jgi:1-acyl-sn-glycerol-3-phosphate acyltransferase
MATVDSTFAGDSRASHIFYRFARGCVLLFCKIMFRVSWEGAEHVPPSGAYVLAPVHRSNMDILVACIVTKRRIRYMGKDSLWKKQPWRWLLSALGGFPVTRGTADREALLRCIDVLKNGEPLVLYPEGERKNGPIVQPLFDGAAYVASKAGVPIVPVGIGGTEKVNPRGQKGIKPGKVHLIVGPPIPPPVAGENGRVSRQALSAVSERLHDELQKLFDVAQARAGSA